VARKKPASYPRDWGKRKEIRGSASASTKRGCEEKKKKGKGKAGAHLTCLFGERKKKKRRLVRLEFSLPDHRTGGENPKGKNVLQGKVFEGSRRERRRGRGSEKKGDISPGKRSSQKEEPQKVRGSYLADKRISLGEERKEDSSWRRGRKNTQKEEKERRV